MAEKMFYHPFAKNKTNRPNNMVSCCIFRDMSKAFRLKNKRRISSYKIVVFFSPSYEVRKNNAVADVTVYLPLDTYANAKKFIRLAHPTMVFLSNMNFGQTTLMI
jgi:hypothetical protein